LKVPKAINQKYIDEWVPQLWTRIGYDPDDKSTWEAEYLHLPRHREVRAEDFAPAAWAKITELAGGEHMMHPDWERYNGDSFIVNFGSEEKANFFKSGKKYDFKDRSNWHTDDDWYRMFLDSAGNALTIIHCFTDIPENGGGTYICEDGIKGILEKQYEHPEGLDPPIGTPLATHCRKCSKYDQVVAEAGDVILLHGDLPHCAGPNYLHYARIISNPHASLKDSHNLNRPDGNYTLIEQVILNALGRESIPEFKPTRERKFYFPRNSGFKQAYAEIELERMRAAARAKGLPEDSVDSLWAKQGTQEWKDYLRHNMFDLPIPDSGLLMQQHSIGTFDATSLADPPSLNTDAPSRAIAA